MAINILSEELKQLEKEVIEVNNNILKICEVDERVKQLYKGCLIYVIYSNSILCG
jgi:hypothetical protein